MAVYSTETNGKDEYLAKTLESLKQTVDFKKHRLQLSINSSTEETKKIIFNYIYDVVEKVHVNETNIGTAEAINKIWRERLPGENAIKMDDDIIIHSKDWLYLMEESIRRDRYIGQIGLKRRDLNESPDSQDPFYKSSLQMIPHKPGEKWIVVENVNHVMGTCVMHSSALLDKIGYLWQPGLYGFDDSFMSLRSKLAGFKNCFLTSVDIEHIDRGDTWFKTWKEEKAGQYWDAYKKAHREFSNGTKNIYYNPFA